MKEVFEIQNPAYNFRSEATHFKRENVKTTHYCIQSVRYLTPKIWDMLPNNIKNHSSLSKFKNSIKSSKPNKCPCRLCIYIYKYILYFLIFYIHFVFVYCAEWGSCAWFPSVVVVFFVRRLCRFFGRFAQGSAEAVHFLGNFLAGELDEIFVFCAVVATIFCILLVYLFIYYYYYYYY